MQKIAKLIKVSHNHFVVGIEESVNEGDYGVLLALGHKGKGRGWFIFKHDNSQVSKLNSLCTPLYKITHSTQVSVLDEEEQKKVIKLDLSEAKELSGEVDIESKAWDWIDLNSHKWSNNTNEVGDNYGSFIEGYKQCLQDYAVESFSEDLYSKIENLIIFWSNDGTKTAGYLTREIMDLLKNQKKI